MAHARHAIAVLDMFWRLALWTSLTWPLVLTMAWLWLFGWVVMRERPDISYWHAIQWAWGGFLSRQELNYRA